VPQFPLIPHFLSRWVKTALNCYTSPAIFMYIYKKLHFWKRRRNDAVTNSNICTKTYNFTSETSTQVSSIAKILRCDAGTQVDSNLTHEASTQTTKVNEQLETKTDSGAADTEKEELQNKIAALETVLEEKDCQIQKQNATISAMKERTRSEIQFMKEEIEKTPLLRKVRAMREEIEEKDRHIQKQNATISAMKEQT